MSLIESYRIERFDGMDVAVVRFTEPLEVLSSAVLNGGDSVSSALFIVQVVPNAMIDDPPAMAESIRDGLGLPKDSVCMMTAAEVRHVFNVRKGVSNGVEVEAAVTAGLANHSVAGDEILDWDARFRVSESRRRALMPGTINIAVVSPQPLTTEAKVNLFIPLVEAKTAAMNDLGFFETGTSSDCMAVFSPIGDDRSVYAGTATDIGAAAARAVRAGVGYALQRRGEHPVPELLFERLDRIGAKDDVVDFIKDLFPTREDAERYYRDYLNDGRNALIADMALFIRARYDSMRDDGNADAVPMAMDAFKGMTGQDPVGAEGVIDAYVLSVVRDIRGERR